MESTRNEPLAGDHLQSLLDRLRDGDPAARDALIGHGLERFRLLARKMFRRQRDLRRLDATDDVLQKAMVRLHRALGEVKPATARDFVGLAARQIRWVLADLGRKMAVFKNVMEIDPPTADPHDPRDGPHDYLEWTEFHARISALPAGEREMYDLLFYEGLTQLEAASLLGISLRTIKRRWQRARQMLREALRDEFPVL